MQLSAIERKILNYIQQGIPLEPRPFKTLAEKVSIGEEGLIDKIKDLKDRGIIRGISAGINHINLGFKSTLVAFKTTPDNLETVVREVVVYPEVTHCFLRDGEYNLWAVFIYRNNRLRQFLTKMSSRLGEKNIISLPTQRQFKLKTNIKL